jgi:subtilisin family serine protease
MRKTVLSLLSMSLACALGAGASALAPAVAVADETPIVAAAATDAVLVRFVTGTSADAATSAVRGLSTVQAKAIGKTDLEGYVTLSVADGHTADEAIAELENLNVVESAQKNYSYSLVDSERESLTSLVAMELPSTTVENPLVAQMQVSDPMVVDQWALTSMSVFDAWDTARCERSVTVALIDLGCDVTHEDLRDNIVTTHNSYAAVNGGDVNNVSPISVNFNHGTHVAGIIGAVTNNSIGVAGVSHNARILPIKVVNDAGDAYTNALVDAYQFILDNADAMNIRVVNISIGSKVD